MRSGKSAVNNPPSPAAPHLLPILIIIQNPERRPIQILELTRSCRPKECRQPQQPKPKRDGQQQREDRHLAAPRSRSALATTTSDEPDIASAAISGVTSPAIASGTARTL